MATLWQHQFVTEYKPSGKTGVACLFYNHFKQKLNALKQAAGFIQQGIKKKNVMPGGVIPLKEGIDATRP